MSAQFTANITHLTFYGDRRTREVHNLAFRSPNCRVEAIKVGVKFVPDTLQEAQTNGYKDCPHCTRHRKSWESSLDEEDL